MAHDGTAYHTGLVQRKCELPWRGGVQTVMLCTKSILLLYVWFGTIL